MLLGLLALALQVRAVALSDAPQRAVGATAADSIVTLKWLSPPARAPAWPE